VFQGQTLLLITNICNLRTKKFYNIGTRWSCAFVWPRLGRRTL